MTKSNGLSTATTAGIILAAGTASRMGNDKLLLPFKGIPLVQHVVNAARNSHLSSVTVVLPEHSRLEEHLSLTGCTVAYSINRKDGQAESLKTGLKNIPPQMQGVMVLLGDLPLIRTATINHLLTVFSDSPDHWIIPRHQAIRGNPVTIPSSYFTKILNLSGDTGARPLLTLPDTPKRMVELDDVGPFFDIDTPQQYAMLLNNYE